PWSGPLSVGDPVGRIGAGPVPVGCVPVNGVVGDLVDAPVDAPAGHLAGLDADPVGLGPDAPVAQVPLGDAVALVGVGELMRPSLDQHAPALVPLGVDAVDFEAHRRALGQAGQLGAGVGAED